MNWAGNLMRLDIFMIIVGILLVVAMVLTLLYGKDYSRHGYGSVLPVIQGQAADYPADNPVSTVGALHHALSASGLTYGQPCRIG